MITNVLLDDKNIITYRKSLNKITGGLIASILLQQIIYWAGEHDWGAFYKFKEPCQHILYREGDSWTEELGISRKQFDSALKKIATKVTKGTSKYSILNSTQNHCLVLYWTTKNRITHYQLNVTLLERKLQALYS